MDSVKVDIRTVENVAYSSESQFLPQHLLHRATIWHKQHKSMDQSVSPALYQWFGVVVV